MATIDIVFNYSDSSEDRETFEADGSLLATIADYAKDTAESKTEDYADDPDWEGDVECVDWDVRDTDMEHASQQDYDDFDDLDEWGEYCEEVDKYGEAYCLRYADFSDENFEEHYEGCWSSEEEFVQNLVESCDVIPDHLQFYIDWEKMARDYMMDYSSYDGYEGIHIFRD